MSPADLRTVYQAFHPPGLPIVDGPFVFAHIHSSSPDWLVWWFVVAGGIFAISVLNLMLALFRRKSNSGWSPWKATKPEHFMSYSRRAYK